LTIARTDLWNNPTSGVDGARRKAKNRAETTSREECVLVPDGEAIAGDKWTEGFTTQKGSLPLFYKHRAHAVCSKVFFSGTKELYWITLFA